MKNYKIAKSFLLISICTMSGCTSFFGRLRSTFGPDRPPIYPGLQTTGKLLGSATPEHLSDALGYILLLMDMPVSFAFDTLVLPFDIYGQIDFDKRAVREQNAELMRAQQDQWTKVHAKLVVDRIADQNELGVLATHSDEPDVGMFAVDRLTDQFVLAQVARSQMSCDRKIRIAALQKVTDQSVVLECAKSDRDPFVRQKAVGCLQNQNDLAQLAEEGSSSAIFKLKDQQLMAQVAISARTFEVRYEAFRKLDLTGFSYAQKISPNPLISYG